MSARDAMQMALDAMASFEGGTSGLYRGEFAEEIAALRERLEQQAEPVAWMHTTATGHVYFRKKPQDAVFNPQPLYLHPPSKPDPAADAMRHFNHYGVTVIAPQDKETS